MRRHYCQSECCTRPPFYVLLTTGMPALYLCPGHAQMVGGVRALHTTTDRERGEVR